MGAPDAEALERVFENIRRGVYTEKYGPYDAYFVGYSERFGAFHLSLVPDSYCHDLPYATLDLQVDASGNMTQSKFFDDDMAMAKAFKDGSLGSYVERSFLRGAPGFEKAESGDPGMVDLTEQYRAHVRQARGW